MDLWRNRYGVWILNGDARMFTDDPLAVIEAHVCHVPFVLRARQPENIEECVYICQTGSRNIGIGCF